MNIISFLRDRLLYLSIYILNVILVVLVIQLDMLQSKLSLSKDNVIYIFVLSLAGIFFYLLIEYMRHLPFYRQLLKIKQSSKRQLDNTLQLENAVTNEQHILQEIIHENYKQYVSELNRYQESQETHHHFTNQWVHSMKTPVSVINLLLQQGEDKRSHEEVKDLIHSIGEENDRMSRGLEMMLHMARLDKFELDVYLTRVDVVGLVREVINQNKKTMISQSIFPKIDCDDKQLFVETDKKWLRFILNQLTTNAIKYSQQGEDKRIIYTITKKGSACILRVADEGIGIPRQDLPRVFDPFFTGEHGRVFSESTGMGLYLTKEVCHRLGHHITIESEEGKGTTVTMTFANESLISDILHHET